MIQIFCEDVTVGDLKEDLYTDWLASVCISEGKVLDEVNLIFCSDEYLLEKNKEFLDHDYFTDIITFDYCVDNQVFGDLFISSDRVQENSSEFGVSFLQELNRVVVHGVLHLCGYKDKTDSEAEVIRSKENFYLNSLNVPRGT